MIKYLLLILGIMGLCMSGMEHLIFWKQICMDVAGVLLFFSSFSVLAIIL